jgi:hypothetical protein
LTDNAKQGYIVTQSYAGRSEQAVLVIGETPKRYRIKAVMRTRMPGRYRWLEAGETALVPKRALSFISMYDHSRGIRIDVSEVYK